MNIPFILNWTERRPEDIGARVSLMANVQGQDHLNSLPAKGVWVAGGFNTSADYSGVEVAVGFNNVNGELYGASCGLVNYAKTNGRFALQVGAVNQISEYNPAGTVIQIGLHNRTENQSSPFINVRGLGKCFRGKKGAELESKVE